MPVAVITGAAGGIGAGLAREAVWRGMRVVLADLDAAAIDVLAAEIGAAALAIRTDVTDPQSLEALADAAFAVEGSIDLLFNNAGVLSTGFSWEIPAGQWDRALAVNLGGIVNGLRAFVPRMLAAGNPARIVNTASVGGFLPSPLMAPYSATKFAAVALTECLAGELQLLKSKIAVSLLAPGPVKSGIFREPPPGSATAFHNAMTGMLDQYGLTGDQFAPLVFDAIERGEYWIVPQPEALEPGLSNRHAAIVSRQAPPFYFVEESS